MGKSLLDMLIYLMEFLRPRRAPDKLMLMKLHKKDHSTKGRLDRAISPKGEAPGSTMSYRGIFEMVAMNVMRDLKIDGAWSIDVVRVRTVHDAPMYQIVITVNHPALLNVQAMLDIEMEMQRNITIISKWARQGLRQISWALGKSLTAPQGAEPLADQASKAVPSTQEFQTGAPNRSVGTPQSNAPTEKTT